MPDPFALPPELSNTIWKYIIRDEPTPARGDENEDDEEAAQTLDKKNEVLHQVKRIGNCRLVNRTWYEYTTPQPYSQLYSTFLLPGRYGSFPLLWRFLRTMVERPHLRTLVEHVDIADDISAYWCKLQEPARNLHTSTLKEWQIVVKLGSKIGYNEDDLITARCQKHLRPFTAILLSLLPNLKTLRLSIDQNSRKTDQLDKLLADPKYFKKLQDMTVFAFNRKKDYSTSGLTTLESQFFLPSLHRLNIFLSNCGALTKGGRRKTHETSAYVLLCSLLFSSRNPGVVANERACVHHLFVY